MKNLISSYFIEYIKNLNFPLLNINFIKTFSDNIAPHITKESWGIYKMESVNFYTLIYNLITNYNQNIDDQFIINKLSSIDDKIQKRIYYESNISHDSILDIQIRKYLFNKIIFHINNNNIFIIPQQSSSCTWYSKYWVLCLCNLIKDPNSYYNFVFDIYNKFKIIINNIFSINNFNDELNNFNSNLNLMNKLYLKLYNLNLFEYPNFRRDMYIIPLNTYITFINTDINVIQKLYTKSELIDTNIEIYNFIEVLELNNNNTIMFFNTVNKHLYNYIIEYNMKDIFNVSDNITINSLIDKCQDIIIKYIKNCKHYLGTINNTFSNINEYKLFLEELYNYTNLIDFFKMKVRLLIIVKLIILFYKIDNLDDNYIYIDNYRFYNIIKFYSNNEQNIVYNSKMLYKIYIIYFIIYNIFFLDDNFDIIKLSVFNKNKGFNDSEFAHNVIYIQIKNYIVTKF